MAKLAHSTVIVMEGLGDSLALCLVLPHSSTYKVVDVVDCHHQLLTRQRVKVTFPSLAITSRLTLATHLMSLQLHRMFTQQAQFAPLSSQQGFRLKEIFHIATIHIQERPDTPPDKKTSGIGEVRSVILNRPFSFLVEQKPLNRTVMVGRFSQPVTGRN